MRPLRTLCNFFVWMLGLLADFAISRPHSGKKSVDEFGDMYGMDPRAVLRSLHNARTRAAAAAATPAEPAAD